MLRLVAFKDNDESQPIFMFGLSQENIARLIDDQPVTVDLSTMLDGAVGEVVIFAGKDEHDMMNQLRPAIGPDTRVVVDPQFGEDVEEDDPRAGQ